METPDIKQDIQKDVNEKQKELNVIDKNKDKVFSEAEVKSLNDQNGEKIKLLENKISLLNKKLEDNKTLFTDSKEYNNVKNQIQTLQKTIDQIQDTQVQLNAKEVINKQEAPKIFLKNNDMPTNYEGFLSAMGVNNMSPTQKEEGYFNSVNTYIKTMYGGSLGILKDFKDNLQKDNGLIKIGNSYMQFQEIYKGLTNKKSTDIKNDFSKANLTGDGSEFDRAVNSANYGELQLLNIIKANEIKNNTHKDEMKNLYINKDQNRNTSYIKDFDYEIKDDAGIRIMNPNPDKKNGIDMLEDISGKHMDDTMLNDISKGKNITIKEIEFTGINPKSKNMLYLQSELKKQYPYGEFTIRSNSLAVKFTVNSIKNWYLSQKKESYENRISAGNPTGLLGSSIDYLANSNISTKQAVAESLDDKNIPDGVRSEYIDVNQKILENFGKNSKKDSKIKYDISYPAEGANDGVVYKTIQELNTALENKVEGNKNISLGILFRPIQTKTGYVIQEYEPIIKKNGVIVSTSKDKKDLFA